MEKRFRAISTVQYVIITVVAIMMAVAVAAWLWTQQQAAMQAPVEWYGGVAYVDDAGNVRICLRNLGNAEVRIVSLTVGGQSIQTAADDIVPPASIVLVNASGVSNIPPVGSTMSGEIAFGTGQSITLTFRVVDDVNNYVNRCPYQKSIKIGQG